MKHEPVTSHTTRYAHQAWLASLGMLAALQKQGGKLFSEFVKEGKRVEARNRVTRAQKRAEDGSFAETVTATKAAYQEKLATQLQEWDAQLDQLMAKAQKARADTRIKIEDELASLKAQRAALQKKLDALHNRGDEAWEDLKDGVEKAWGDIRDAVGKVAAHFK